MNAGISHVNTRRPGWLLVLIAAVAANTAAAAAVSEAGDDSALTGSVSVGITYNGNVYRSPAEPYFDYALSSAPKITPTTQTGFVMPLELRGQYVHHWSENNRAFAGLALKGQYYLDAALRNANRNWQELVVGDTMTFSKKRLHRRTLKGELVFGAHQETYYDRDDGLDKVTSTGLDISNRYRYLTKGARFRYDDNLARIRYGFRGAYFIRDYADPVAVSQYDHHYFALSGDVGFRAAKVVNVRLGYNFYTYEYDDRSARNATGVLSAYNPALVYRYNLYELALSKKLNQDWDTKIEADYTERTDAYAGYNDYRRMRYRAVARWQMAEGLTLEGGFEYWKRIYPNAYAFDSFAQPQKIYDGSDVQIKLAWKTETHGTVAVEMSKTRELSSDARYEFDREQFLVSGEWRF